MRRSKPGKPKRVTYELIDHETITGAPMYALLRDLVWSHHEDLRDARIALAWCTSWKPDVDGRVILGKCRKATDLDRELVPFDFVILLRRQFWLHLGVSDEQRRALLDHELCHARGKYDDKGEPVYDERGRRVYRIRKHDIEEFTEIVTRHGCYKQDLEQFYSALRRSAVQPFRHCENCAERPGWVMKTDESGVSRVARCSCWLAWSQQRDESVPASA